VKIVAGNIKKIIGMLGIQFRLYRTCIQKEAHKL